MINWKLFSFTKDFCWFLHFLGQPTSSQFTSNFSITKGFSHFLLIFNCCFNVAEHFRKKILEIGSGTLHVFQSHQRQQEMSGWVKIFYGWRNFDFQIISAFRILDPHRAKFRIPRESVSCTRNWYRISETFSVLHFLIFDPQVYIFFCSFAVCLRASPCQRDWSELRCNCRTSCSHLCQNWISRRSRSWLSPAVQLLICCGGHHDWRQQESTRDTRWRPSRRSSESRKLSDMFKLVETKKFQTFLGAFAKNVTRIFTL